MTTLLPHKQKIFSLAQILFYFFVFHATSVFGQKSRHRPLFDQIIFPDPLLTSRQRIAQRARFCKQLHEARIKHSTLSDELKLQLMYGYFEASRINNAHKNLISCIACSSDEQLLALGSDAGRIHLWRSHDFPFVFHQELSDLDKWITALTFSPDGQFLVAGSLFGCIKIWKREENNNFNFHEILMNGVNKIHSIKFSPDGQLLGSVSDDKMIKIWKLDQNDSFIIHLSAHFSSDGQFLMSASDNAHFSCWKASQDQMFIFDQSHLLERELLNAEFSYDKQYFASATGDGTIKLWMAQKTETYTLIQKITALNAIQKYLFLPRSSTLVVSRNKSIILYKPYWTLLPEQTAALVSLYEKNYSSIDSLSDEEQELLQTIPQGAWPEKLKRHENT